MTPALTIRPAHAGDAAMIAALLDHMGHSAPADDLPSRLDRYRAHSGGEVLLALVGDDVAGFIAIDLTHPINRADPVLHISLLSIAPRFQRQGIGQSLVLAAEEFGRQRGCAVGTVTSAEHRGGAHAFYPSIGWPLTGRRFGKYLSIGLGP